MRLIAFLLLLFPTCAMAGEKEAEAYGLLRKYCLATSAQPATMKTLLGVNDARELTPDEAMAKYGIAKGLWVVAGKSSDYGVYSLGYGHCGILHRGLNFKEVTKVAHEITKADEKRYASKDLISSTIHFVWNKREKKKPTITTRFAVEIIKFKRGDKKNLTSLDAFLEPLYQRLITIEEPKATCTAERRGWATCG